MFDEEICKVLDKVRVVWYPKEKLCLVISRNLIRTYKEVPKKYIKEIKNAN